MSDYNWCHGPRCHKRHTTTRIRGVKGSKVLRSVKINVSGEYPKGVWKYFCDQTCMHDFIATHIEQFVQLHPRLEALERKFLCLPSVLMLGRNDGPSAGDPSGPMLTRAVDFLK